jgi:hypothetical protein
MSQDLDRNPPNTERRELVPASSAHAYIDYLEGCLAQVREHMEQTNERLRGMEVLFDRRTTEFEARLDNAQAEIKDLKLVALHLAERLNAIEHPTQAKTR